MSTDREILEWLCPTDPWCHSYEGLGDHCLFCESDRSDRTVERLFFHEVDCPWIAAVDHLGRDRPIHFVGFPPSRQPTTCDICGADPDATFDSHVQHITRDFARRKEAEYLAKITGGTP